MNDFKYVIFDFNEVSKIDFNEVQETSILTLVRSVDGTKTFVKYNSEMPLSVNNLSSKTKEFTHSEIIDMLSTSEWSKPIEEYRNAN